MWLCTIAINSCSPHNCSQVTNAKTETVLCKESVRSKSSKQTKNKNKQTLFNGEIPLGQQTQPTFDAESGNRTRATLVGGLRGRQMFCPPPPPTYRIAWIKQKILRRSITAESFYPDVVERNCGAASIGSRNKCWWNSDKAIWSKHLEILERRFERLPFSQKNPIL